MIVSRACREQLIIDVPASGYPCPRCRLRGAPCDDWGKRDIYPVWAVHVSNPTMLHMEELLSTEVAGDGRPNAAA